MRRYSINPAFIGEEIFEVSVVGQSSSGFFIRLKSWHVNIDCTSEESFWATIGPLAHAVLSDPPTNG
jgi:hypothetical protein